MTLLWGFLSRVSMKVWLFAAGVLAFLAVLAKVRKSGADAERAKQLRSTVKAVEKARAVESRIDSASPAERDRLRRKWSAPE